MCALLSTALYASPEKRVTRSAVEEETSKSEERASYEWTGREEKKDSETRSTFLSSAHSHAVYTARQAFKLRAFENSVWFPRSLTSSCQSNTGFTYVRRLYRFLVALNGTSADGDALEK